MEVKKPKKGKRVRSRTARELGSPRYHQRIVESKKRYFRKRYKISGE
jgi:hypothetical protein